MAFCDDAAGRKGGAMRAMLGAVVILPTLLALALGLSASTGGRHPSEQLPGSYLFNGFEPVDPEIVPWYIDSASNGTAARRAWPSNPEELRALLPDFAMTTTVKQYTGTMEVRYLKGFGTLDAGLYEVIIDIIRFRPEDTLLDNGTRGDAADEEGLMRIQKARVGVGVRIIARINVANAGTDITGLTSLGAKGSFGNMHGTVSAYCYGVQPLPIDFKALAEESDLSRGLLRAIMHAAGDVQSRIDLHHVRLTPHIFSIKRAKPPSGALSADEEAREARRVHDLLRQGGS